MLLAAGNLWKCPEVKSVAPACVLSDARLTISGNLQQTSTGYHQATFMNHERS